MIKTMKIEMKIRRLIFALMALIATGVCASDEIPASGLQYINTNYQFIYHSRVNMGDYLKDQYWNKNKRESVRELDYKYEFIGEVADEENENILYSIFALTEYTVYGYDKNGVLFDSATFQARYGHVALRENNGKVYACVLPTIDKFSNYYGCIQMDVQPGETAPAYKYRVRIPTYGTDSNEVVIYDNNLEIGDTYCVADKKHEDCYVPAHKSDWRNAIDDIGKKETFLNLWDGGQLTLEKISYDDAGREVRTFRQKRTEWWDGYSLHDDTAEQAPESRTFEFIEGIGCTKGFLYNPGLYPPFVKQSSDCDIIGKEKMIASPSIVLTRVIDKRDGSIVYEKPSDVKDLTTDASVFAGVPEYYNLQGFKVAHPQNGEIYIVKQGSKTRKEVYRAH